MGITERNKAARERRIIAATVLFVVFAMMYFMRVQIPFMMVFPLGTLFFFGLGLIPWQVCLAVFFSAAGDAMGVKHQFIPQMGLFMLAHIMMISWYLPRIIKQGKGYLVFSLSLVAGLVVFAFTCILTHVEGTVVSIGTSLYCIIISLMLLCSMLQVCEGDIWSKILPLGAFLFLASDMVLAWNKFVSDVLGERYFIMVPYYLGQLLIFWGAAMCLKKKN